MRFIKITSLNLYVIQAGKVYTISDNFDAFRSLVFFCTAIAANKLSTKAMA